MPEHACVKLRVCITHVLCCLNMTALPQKRVCASYGLHLFRVRACACNMCISSCATHSRNTQLLCVQPLWPVEDLVSRYSRPPFNFPSQFNFRSKALMLWQQLGGVDVFIYAVYVQEYGDDCPEPNRRCAYLSYLDSVKYIEPPALRTDVYHEVLMAYIEDLKHRGFNQVSVCVRESVCVCVWYTSLALVCRGLYHVCVFRL